MKLFGIILFAVVTVCAGLGVDSLWDWTNNWLNKDEKYLDNVVMVFSPDDYTGVLFPMRDFSYLATHPRFDKSKKTVIYFHGWLESGKLDLSVLAIRCAYIDRDDHNVVSVDWSHYAKNLNYHTHVIPQLKHIAEHFAEQLRKFVENGYPIENIHLVGHSLGGQVVGKIGRHLKKITNNHVSVPRIIALDPAGPGFEDRSTEGFDPISYSDGDFVQIIHTCGGQLGMLHRVGSADFYPNGGSRQKGCDVDAAALVIGEPFQYVCDHARSWHFYQLTVREPEIFPAIRCDSWEAFMGNGTCYPDDIAYMGFGANPNKTGKYFLQTNSNMFNLSRTTDGLRYIKLNVTQLDAPTNVEHFEPLNIDPEMILV